MADYSDNILTKSCSGKSAVNLGVSGSTAHEFFTGEAETEGCIYTEVCSAEAAFDPEYGSGYTHAWLSVGGNDWLMSECDTDIEPTLEEDIGGVIDSVFKESPNKNLKLLITGYAYVSEPAGDCPEGEEKVERLQNTIQKAVANNSNSESILFVEATLELFGGSNNKYSDKKWFADAIHLNKAGYNKLFSLPEIQDFLGCGGTRTCQDDDDWVIIRNGKEKGCEWFNNMNDDKKKKNCKRRGEDAKGKQSRGTRSCPVSCDTCPSECKDDKDWEFRYKGEMKGCDFLSTLGSNKKKKKLCKKKGGKKSCPVACGNCP